MQCEDVAYIGADEIVGEQVLVLIAAIELDVASGSLLSEVSELGKVLAPNGDETKLVNDGQRVYLLPLHILPVTFVGGKTDPE